MKKLLVAFAMLIAVVICGNKSFAQSTPVTDAARQLGFYIAHNDGIKACMMLANSEESATLFGHIDVIQNNMNGKGKFYDVEVVSSTAFSAREASVVVRYKCEDSDSMSEYAIMVEYVFQLVDDQWKLNTKNLKN